VFGSPVWLRPQGRAVLRLLKRESAQLAMCASQPIGVERDFEPKVAQGPCECDLEAAGVRFER
jgi:hypothetical protein